MQTLNEITSVKKLSDEAARLSGMDTEKLKKELGDVMKITAQCLIRLAAIVKILEERGEDLSDLRIGLIGYLRRIACGQILPEVVASLQGAPMLLRRVSTLPIPDQERVASTEALPVVVIQDGAPTHRLVPLLSMGRNDIQQVFASDHIRNESEQITWLRNRQPERAKAKGTAPIHVDARRRGIVVTGENIFIPASELVAYLARVTD